MNTTRQMRERRAKIIAQLREMDATAEATGDGAMTPEQTAAFEALKVALVQLEDALSRRALIEDAERRAGGTPIGGTGDRLLDEEIRTFSLMRLMGHMGGLNVDAGRERPCPRSWCSSCG